MIEPFAPCLSAQLGGLHSWPACVAFWIVALVSSTPALLNMCGLQPGVSLMFSAISWLVFGLIVGAIARFLVPGNQSMGWIATIALGVVGSFVGGGISWLIFGSPTGNVNPAGWIFSIVGAVILVLAYGQYMKSKSS